MTVKDNRKASDAPVAVTGYNSLDRRGVWFFSNAFFPMEDPTKAGKGQTLPRFEERSYTQAEETDWVKGQWRAGVFKKFDGDPRDEGTKEVVYVPEAAAAAPKDKTELVDPKQAEKEAADKKALEDKAAADRLAADKRR